MLLKPFFFLFLARDQESEDSVEANSDQQPQISFPSTTFARETMNALVVRKQQSEASAQTEVERSFSLPVTPRTAQTQNRRRTVVGAEINSQHFNTPDPLPRHNSTDLSCCDDDVTDADTVTSRCRTVWLAVTRVATSHAGLFVILILYTVIGGAIFQAIEGPHESEQRSDLQRARDDVIAAAWQLAHNSSDIEDFREHLSQVLDAYDVTNKHAFEHGVTAGDDLRIWDFWGSIFFSTTVYSTVGECKVYVRFI